VKKRKRGPWLDWGSEKKQRYANILLEKGYSALRLELGPACPPRNTVKGWLQATNAPKKVGRPTILTPVEEEQLLTAITAVRRSGAIIDRETLVCLALHVVQQLRGTTSTVALTANWAKSYIQRYNVTTRRSITSGRPPCTPADIQSDNLWRKQLLALISDPSKYGLPSPGPIPDGLVFCADETPVHYRARTSRTYVVEPAEKQTRALGGSERRCTTGTPVCTTLGTVALFQLLWRGKTALSEPRHQGMPLHFDVSIFVP